MHKVNIGGALAMYKENIIEEIKATKLSKEQEGILIGEFYVANMNLISLIAKDMCLSQEDYYDCIQLGYDAIVDAVKVYNPGKFSFLSYFRRTFKHKIYLHNLEFKYPMRIKSPGNAKTFDTQFVYYGVIANDLYNCDDFTSFSDACYTAENKIMSETIIEIVKNELNPLQYAVIYEMFWCNMTKKQIAVHHKITYNDVRSVYFKSLRVLRKNNRLQHIANDMFGI